MASETERERFAREARLARVLPKVSIKIIEINKYNWSASFKLPERAQRNRFFGTSKSGAEQKAFQELDKIFGEYSWSLVEVP